MFISLQQSTRVRIVAVYVIKVSVHHTEMVCEKCEKKLSKVVTPDPWKAGARNTTESGGRKLNENKALTGAKQRFDPIGETFRPCR